MRITKTMLHNEISLLQENTRLKLALNSNIQGKQLCYCCNGKDTRDGIGVITYYGTTRELWEQVRAINVFLAIEKMKGFERKDCSTCAYLIRTRRNLKPLET